MAFVTLPATAGLILIGPEVIALLFQYGEFDQQSTDMTSYALIFHAVGLFAIATTRVFQQVFYAYKYMKTPTIIAAIVMGVNIVLCIVLSGPLKHGGIALAGSIAAIVNGLLLVWFLRRRIGALGGSLMSKRMARITVASLIMTAAVWGLKELWPAPTPETRLLLGLWIAAACATAVVTYLGSCRLLKVDELAGAWKAIARKLGRGKTTDTPDSSG
jgi:putative peptidoglycan lipid II flippase